MKNKIMILTIIVLIFVIILIPLKGSHAFYVSNQDLDIVSTKVGDFRDNIIKLRENDKNENLSKELLGDIYRYQGTDDVANWICFGTTENCGLNEDDIDKYMYRIIGITPEGELKLLKETFIKESEATAFAWNDTYTIEIGYKYSCPDGVCPMWGSNTLFKRINGTSNGNIQGSGKVENGGNTDIYVNSTQYDYLKSINGDSSWYKAINAYFWMYGDIGTFTNMYYGDIAYDIESGNISTTHYDGAFGNVTEQPYTWTESVQAPIGLLNISDYMWAYPSKRGAGSSGNIVKSWIHFLKDGYNNSLTFEWLMTRYGIYKITFAYVYADTINEEGSLGSIYINNERGVRPVFYLKKNILIIRGNGTKTNPYILNVIE